VYGLSTENNDLGAMRLRYGQGSLRREDLAEDPLEQFQIWFDQAREAGVVEPNAMTLATVSADGRPAARTVLLKGIVEGRFQFFTNYGSRKAAHLEAADGKASLLFAWLALERQVQIRGVVEKVSREESEAYFRSRPRESQIGAWASLQSEVAPDRGALEESFAEAEGRFEGVEVPLPDFWGGYALRAQTIEFWQGRPGRLHDRFEYRVGDSEGASWEVKRLFP